MSASQQGSIAPNPLAVLAQRAVFGAPSSDWVFVEAGTLAWQQWTDFCRQHIGRAPVAAHVLAQLHERELARRRGRSFPSLRPPGVNELDRMRLASGERPDHEASS